MKRVLFLISIGIALHAPTAFAESKQQVKVVLPPHSALTFNQSEEAPDQVFFNGQLELRGVLLAYWDAQYPEGGPVDKAEPVRQMSLRFYPDAPSRHALPRFESAYDDGEPAERVFLYREGSDMSSFRTDYAADETAAIEGVMAMLDHVPDTFLQHREGYAVQPVTVTLQGLASFVEGNARFLYARAEKIEPVDLSEYLLAQIPDSDPNAYLAVPWLEVFQAGEGAVLRAAPVQDADEVMRLETGRPGIEKIATAADGWLEVRVRDEHGEELARGFVQTARLVVVN